MREVVEYPNLPGVPTLEEYDEKFGGWMLRTPYADSAAAFAASGRVVVRFLPDPYFYVFVSSMPS